MPDVVIIIIIGTALFLLLGMFIAFMTLVYQKRRLEHQEEIKGLEEAYQKEILRAQLEMQEQTFLFISQEIHDNVGQLLSLVRLNVSTLDTMGNSSSAHKINASKELLDQAIQDLRDLSKRLNSKYTTSQPLSALLQFQLGLLQKTGVVDTQFELEGEERDLNPEKKLIAFRIAQEALNNVIRHAEADTINAKLMYSGEKMALRIGDNGKGFPATLAGGQPPANQGTGTHNMRYRATLIGATLRIEGQPGSGTVVLLELPLN